MNKAITPMQMWARRAAVAALLLIPFASAEEAEKAKPSTFASAEEIATQIDAYVKELETDLGSDSDYADEQKGRVVKNANTLIVLAQAMGSHDQDHPLKKSASLIIPAAQKLGSASDNLDEAKAAFDELKKAMMASGGDKVTWEPVAELAQLMKQVPIVNNKLRLGVGGRRFDRTVEQNAGLAATLAVIAEASQYDTAYCSTPEEEKKWAKICQDMRNAAAKVREAVRKKDQATAQAGLAELVKTCDECHHDFRD